MKYVRQLLIILSISFLAELMEGLIPIPVAASIYGLVLMLVGLMTGILKLEMVEGAADFLVEIMPIFFIPPTVSIMTSVDALKQMLIPLCVISVVSTLLIMIVTGRVSQSIIRRNNAKGHVQGIEEPQLAAGEVQGVEEPQAQAASTEKGGGAI